MQLFSYFFGATPVAPDWSSLSRAETEAKIIELLDSKSYSLLTQEPLHPISEATQARLAMEVPGWCLFYGEVVVYPEKILLACLASPDAAKWISNPRILTKQAKQTTFIIAALAKFPEVVLNHPGIWFLVNHEVFHSDAFALAIAEHGESTLFLQNEEGDTFLFDRFLTEETVAHLFHVLGRKDFGRLVTTRNKEGEHFAYSYTLNPETVMAVVDALPSELREGFVMASTKKGRLFIKTTNGGSKAVTAWREENGVALSRTTRNTAKAVAKAPQSSPRVAPQSSPRVAPPSSPGISPLTLNTFSKDMWEYRGSPKF